ncbi:unnamed protein product [Thlaspi arvense]|uniref:BHLH domain-containing protein n=1 Tax=Thlaspi arvense TaxID=13288 RepID=A0AAU9RC92_THLAR|nr:unnamed protein product [Thlaspi arvense]
MRGTTMEEKDGVTSFSDVMLSEDVLVSGDDGEDSFGFGFTGRDYPQMLCFGRGNQNDAESLFPESSVPCRDSTASHVSSLNNACMVDGISSRSNKKITGSSDEQNRLSDSKPAKRCKRDQKKSSVGKAKAKKVKLGEKITALQQLVSPYGKTDTASVLHETMGYIKFLQDQVQVLSSPYLKHQPLDDEDNGDINPTTKVKELKSNGLCLVPLDWTVHVENTNGADLWSPAILSPTVNQ